MIVKRFQSWAIIMVVSLSQQSPWFDGVHLNDMLCSIYVTHTIYQQTEQSISVFQIPGNQTIAPHSPVLGHRGVGPGIFFLINFHCPKKLLNCKPACRGP